MYISILLESHRKGKSHKCNINFNKVTRWLVPLSIDLEALKVMNHLGKLQIVQTCNSEGFLYG